MRKKIKVAILIDAWLPFYGGGQVHVLELTERMSDFCSFRIYHAASSSVLSRFLWAISVFPKLMLDHRKLRFDLIHAHAYIAGIPGKILSSVLRVPLVYTVHGCNTLDLQELIKARPEIKIKIPTWKYQLEKFLLTRIKYNRQISVSHHFIRYDNVNKITSIIPNGVDVSEFDKIKVKKRTPFTIITVGRDDFIKGKKYLYEALRIIKNKYPEIKLLDLSQGKTTGKKLVKTYKSCHLFVLPSLSEGHPLTLLEAWAAKLPVIVTDVGDNSKMIKKRENGYLISPADTKGLVTAIIQAYNNQNLEQMGQQGYNLVKKEYSWKKAAELTLKVYKEVLDGSR